MLELYPDQSELVDKVRYALRSHKSVLLQSATGSGKTAMATYIIDAAKNKGRRIGFVVPRQELFKQTAETFAAHDINFSAVAAGRDFNPYAGVYIGMVGTMARRLDKLPKLDLVIFDETHFGSNNLESIVNHYKAQGSYIIGLSATPWKSSGKGLGCWYEHMVTGHPINWLIENKRLSDYKGYAPSAPDLSGVSVSAGDYSKGQLASYMEGQRVLIGDAVSHYRRLAMGRLNIVFCTSIKHSEMTAQAFRDSGIPAAHIDGNTPEDEKIRLIRAYARRELLVLCCCDLLCFGFDLSQASGMDVTIECMSDLKPTKSLALQMQKWGRVLRMKDYPAIILDHAGNFLEHGLPCSPREWTLDDRKQGKKNTEPSVPTRQCDSCFFVHSPAPQCPDCGHVYEIKSREIEQEDGDLQEIDKTAIIKEKRKEQGRAQSLDQLIDLGRRRNYKNPTAWASKIMAARMMR